MSTHPDLTVAARRIAGLVDSVGDDALGRPTPCEGYTVGDLLDHIAGAAVAFTAAAVKQPLDGGPRGDAANLGDDWRTRIPQEVLGLAQAWRSPHAWTGMTAAGGVDLPGDLAGVVALDELVIHGWDLAKATGQPYDVDDETLAACHGFVAQFSAPGQEASREGLFGPPVEVPDDAPLLDRLIGLSGREPEWSPG